MHTLRNKFGDRLKPLGTIADVICGPFGSAIKNTDYQESGIPLVRITNITKEGYMNYDDLVYISEDLGNSLARTQVFAGDIVISQRGSLGQCAIVDNRFEKLNISANIIAIKNIRESSASFIHDYLLSTVGQTLLERSTSGQVQPKITTQDIANILIPVGCDELHLSRIQQDGYSLFSSKLKQAEKVRDNSILELERALNLSFCKAEQELFSYVCLENIKRNSTKRIDPKCYSVKFKNIRSAIDCSNYPKFKLRDLILDITGGDWGYEPEAEKENCQKCLVLRATEISNKDNIEIKEDKAQYRQIEKKKLAAMNVEIGDIIVEKSGGSIDQPVGRVIYVDQLSYNGYPIAYSNFLTKLKINKNLVDPYYLFEYLRFIYKIGLTEVMQNQTNGIRNLIIDEFLDQTIIVPPNHYEIGQQIKSQRLYACEIEKQAEIEWQEAKRQFEKELLGE